MRYFIFTLLLAFIGFGFAYSKKKLADRADLAHSVMTETGASNITEIADDTVNNPPVIFEEVSAADYVGFAKTLIGTPYMYGSVDPSRGFDCSGFINYVSKHFGMKVPRSSVDFTNFGTTVDSTEAKPGDLILFTGTDASRRIVGHMGIITENNGQGIQFIHSSSGKGRGVIISELEGYYETRFVKVIRIIA